MVEPTEISDLEARLDRVRRNVVAGGGPTGGDPLELRVSILEKSFEKLDAKLDTLLEAADDTKIETEKRFGFLSEHLARIEAKLDARASAGDLALVRGRLDTLPTTWQMITLVFGILGGAFLIIKFGLPHAP